MVSVKDHNIDKFSCREVGIYKNFKKRVRKQLSEKKKKRKHTTDQQKVRNQDLDQAIFQEIKSFKILHFSFLNSHQQQT